MPCLHDELPANKVMLSGESNNAFQMCRDDSMNLRGSGEEVGQDQKHGPEHRHRKHGRELLDRIDM